MTIRPATTRDRRALVKMAVRFLGTTPYREFLSEDHYLEQVAHLGRVVDLVLQNGRIFLALERREPIGMLALVLLPHALNGRLFADELVWYVEPEYRSGLAGPKMLRVAEKWARQVGAFCLKMVAPMGPTGSGVVSFYERTGYVAVETAYMKRF